MIKNWFNMVFSFLSDSFNNVILQLKEYLSKVENESDLNEWEKSLLKNLGSVDIFDIERLKEFDEYCLEVKKRNNLNLKLVFDNRYGELGHHFEFSDKIKLEYINLLIYTYYQEVIFRKNYSYSYQQSFFNFIENNKSKFSSEVEYIFSFIDKLPFNLLSKVYSDSNFQKILETLKPDHFSKYIEYLESNYKNVEKIDDWNNTFEIKKDAVQDLESKLEAQKSTYDFVLLNKGFKQLYDQKKIELEKRRDGYSQFAATLVCVPIAVIVGIVIIILTGYEAKLSSLWFLAFPITTLILFLFYFTRVGLQHVRSIQSQMMQLELRMALCQFIHNYAEDSEKLHKKNSAGFEKFENIIFSPLVSSDDKILTTFDGMEQLAKLIGEFRKN